MITTILLILIGIGLSAFFSGSETGFYRVTRVRLIMDAKSGSLVSKALLWLINHPTVVVATVLIGNNLANYLVSLGLVLATEQIFVDWDSSVQTLIPILMTPVLFIYGELLPKYLFYQVPYRLLRSGAPFMLLFTALFLPVSCIVVAIESTWKRIVGGAARKIGSSLERQDLQRVLNEGQEAGVLHSVQRELAQNLFTYGLRPVRQFCLPLRALPSVDIQAPLETAFKEARRTNRRTVGVTKGGRIVGCYQLSDLLLATKGDHLKPISIITAKDSESNLQVLTRLQNEQCPMALILDAQNRGVGFIERDRLNALLLSDQ